MTRVATVTGGAGAIGGAIAASLRAAGHHVVILHRDGDPPVDLAQPDAVRAAAAGVLGRHGRCDVLVHAAAAAPGLTPTPAAVAGTPPEAFAAVRARQAIGRDLEPGDIAAVVAFLVSDAAGAITGQTLCADGGLILR
jgi:NAD(P)-dependent dehydrogenase (short-subunit alcohol dehydrogenase family)